MAPASSGLLPLAALPESGFSGSGAPLRSPKEVPLALLLLPARPALHPHKIESLSLTLNW